MTRATWAIPAAVFAAASALYVLLGSLQDVPLVSPDEFLYGEMSRSVADGDGVALYGTSLNWPTPLYIYLIAVGWLGDSLESGYAVVKAIGAVAACATAFPVWILARRFTSTGPAVIATLLTLAGTWMVATAGLVTENLAFPLSTAALCAAVLALREPARHWDWVALGFAALATLARAQLAVLFAVLLCALLLGALRADDPRAYLHSRRMQLGVLGVIVVAGAIVVLSGSKGGLGAYTAVSDFRPSAGDVISAIGQQWLALVTVTAFLPVAAMLALATQKPMWRDADIAPLLCVTVPTVVLLVLESGYFIAGPKGITWSIERYVMYAAPLLLVLLIVALEQRRLSVRQMAITGVVVVIPLLAVPRIRLALEERAQFGTAKHLDAAFGLAAGPAITLVGALVIAAGLMLVAHARPRQSVLGAGALLLLVLLIQSQAIWHWHIDYTGKFRSQFPDDLSWVDSQAGGPVSRIFVFANSSLFPVADFFNEEVGSVLVPGADPSQPKPRGRICFYNADARGVLQISPGCKVESHIWNDDPITVLSFHGGRTIARDPGLGQIIAVPARPRLQSIVRLPCQRRTLRGDPDGSPPVIPKSGPCGPTMAVDVWTDQAGAVELTFAGGRRARSVENETRSWTLSPGRPTLVRIPVPAGQSTNVLDVDWTRSLGAPQLVDAALISGGTRTPLL